MSTTIETVVAEVVGATTKRHGSGGGIGVLGIMFMIIVCICLCLVCCICLPILCCCGLLGSLTMCCGDCGDCGEGGGCCEAGDD